MHATGYYFSSYCTGALGQKTNTTVNNESSEIIRKLNSAFNDLTGDPQDFYPQNLRHRDSVGNDGIIESSGIQWMNAGRGIIHVEMSEQQEGVLRGFQLWVNLPAKDKMSAPHYQDIQADDVTVFDLSDVTQVRLLSGNFIEYEGLVKPLSGDNPTPLFTDFHSAQADNLELPLKLEMQYFISVYKGEVTVGGDKVAKSEWVVLSQAQ